MRRRRGKLANYGLETGDAHGKKGREAEANGAEIGEKREKRSNEANQVL